MLSFEKSPVCLGYVDFFKTGGYTFSYLVSNLKSLIISNSLRISKKILADVSKSYDLTPSI